MRRGGARSKPVAAADPAATIVPAAPAPGKIDLHGVPRGVTMVTTEEIEAMALLLAALGLHALRPEAQAPADARALLNPLQGAL